VVRTAVLAGLILAALSAAPAGAGEMLAARITATPANWQAAAATLPGNDLGALKQLNASLASRYPGIAASPVPVLLPLDPATLSAEAKPDVPDPTLAGFHASKFFLAGPAGYDATYFIDADTVPGVSGRYVKPVEVEITGAAFVYEIDAPSVGAEISEPKELDDFPRIRRILREAHVRYAFERFGVPYVVAIECFDGRPRAKRLSCRDADLIAIRFLHTLHVAGGTPVVPPPAAPRIDVTRPPALSPSFTYYPSGDLIPNTGYKQLPGRPDDHVYATIRFPLSDAPAFAKSQSFNPWGDCYRTGRNGRIGHKGAPYSCKRNGLPLVFDESAPVNFSYPWRDNFCETRDRRVGQCPGGVGHQGQDIRPSNCVLRNAEADRCEPYQHNVAAVRDGMIWRNAGQYAAYIVANAADAHIRARYMHMNPKRMDADGVFSGRIVRQGDVLGQVGTFDDYERGTSYHLHFDMQVMTRDGWVWVNPYMTLVASYEHLIGARGTELPKDEPAPPKPATPPAPVAAAPAPIEASKAVPEPRADPREAAESKAVDHKIAVRAVTEHKIVASTQHAARRHAAARHKVDDEPRPARKKALLRHAAKKGQLSQGDTTEATATRTSY